MSSRHEPLRRLGQSHFSQHPLADKGQVVSVSEGDQEAIMRMLLVTMLEVF